MKLEFIDISLLKNNPKNFYSLTNIDSLATQIVESRYLEPLRVTPNSDSTYTIISGHRRKAAIQELLKSGMWSESKIPCIVTVNSGQAENFNDLTPEEEQELQLIVANNGQRRNLSKKELVQEIKRLKPLAKRLFDKQPKKERGFFRVFFAKMLGVSESTVQRLEQYDKLSLDVQEAIYNGTITEQLAIQLSKSQIGFDKQNKLIATARVQNRQVSKSDVERLIQFKNISIDTLDAIDCGIITEQLAMRLEKSLVDFEKQNELIATARAQSRQVSESDVDALCNFAEAQEMEIENFDKASIWLKNEIYAFVENLLEKVQAESKSKVSEIRLEVIKDYLSSKK